MVLHTIIGHAEKKLSYIWPSEEKSCRDLAAASTLEMPLTEQAAASLDFLFNNVDLYLKWSSIVRLFFKNAALYTYSASSIVGISL
jgi:hypothetical protein